MALSDYLSSDKGLEYSKAVFIALKLWNVKFENWTWTLKHVFVQSFFCQLNNATTAMLFLSKTAVASW